jgi:hypothetical protein
MICLKKYAFTGNRIDHIDDVTSVGSGSDSQPDGRGIT